MRHPREAVPRTVGARPLTRRALLQGAAAATAVGVVGARTAGAAAPAAAPTDVAAQTLASLAGRSGRYFGTSASLGTLLTDSSYSALVAQQCSVLTPENEFKWSYLRPQPGQPFNFALSDLSVDYAEQRGMRVRGNCFTWANSNPWWFQVPQFLNPGNALQVLEEHITTVMTRYRGRVFSWDVVNEATNGDGYYPTVWAQLLGPRYIDNAFTIAHRADPQAQLVLNEYNLEYVNRYSRDRQRVVLRVLDDILSRDIPVHALGVQAHLEAWAIRDQFDPRQHRSFLRSVASMGLKIVVTELDVIDQNLPTDVESRDAQVAETYKRFLGTVLEEPAVEGVVSWGLSDAHSWMNSSEERFEREDGEPQRPLLYDPDMLPKPSRDATAEAFLRARRALPPRR